MAPHPQQEWLSLRETAELLGVHPSTIRNWSNQGALPVHRTQGGHRRYRRDEIELWMQERRGGVSASVADTLHHAMRHIHLKITEGQLQEEAWYQRLDEQARQQYRLSGRTLFQGLNIALSSPEEDGVAEARALGYEYASRAHRYGLSLTEATRAFLFFRNALLEALMATYQNASVSAAETWRQTMQEVTAFTDQVLLSLLEMFEAYEKHQKAAHGPLS